MLQLQGCTPFFIAKNVSFGFRKGIQLGLPSPGQAELIFHTLCYLFIYMK